MNDTYKIRSIGGALLVTIPQKIVRDLNLKAGDEVVFRRVGTSRIISVEPRGKPTAKRERK